MYLYLYLCLYLYLYLYQLVPYLIYRFLIYLPTYLLYAGTTSAGNHLFIHSFIQSSTPSLPSSLPVVGLVYMYICMYLCVYASVYLRVSVRVHVHTYSTHKRYISKVHIKDTYQRYMYTCILGYVVVSYFKNIFADPIDTKNHPTNVRAPALSFTNFTR